MSRKLNREWKFDSHPGTPTQEADIARSSHCTITPTLIVSFYESFEKFVKSSKLIFFVVVQEGFFFFLFYVLFFNENNTLKEKVMNLHLGRFVITMIQIWMLSVKI